MRETLEPKCLGGLDWEDLECKFYFFHFHFLFSVNRKQNSEIFFSNYHPE